MIKRGCCALVSVLCSFPVLAGYPERPVTVVVGFPAGSAPDVAARMVGQKLGERLGETVVVENRVGAAGTIASTAVANAAADGYTLLLGTASGLTVAPALYRSVRFDPVKSFTPIGQFIHGAFILSVRSDLPVQDLKSLIAYAGARPGQLTYGSSGNGSLHHLCMEMFKRAAGVDIVHVPYKGSPSNWLALSRGEVDLTCDSMSNSIPALQANKVRALAVTGKNRLGQLPALATFTEQGMPQVNVDFWYGLLAPAGTPTAIVDRLNAAMGEAVKDADIINRYEAQGIEVMQGTPEAFGALLARESVEWAQLIETAGIKVD